MPEQTPTDLVPAEQRAELRARLSYATPADAETAYRCMGAPLLANDPAMFLRLLDLEDEVGQLRSETTPKGTGVVYTAGVVDIDSLAIPDLTEQERAAFLAGPESTPKRRAMAARIVELEAQVEHLRAESAKYEGGQWVTQYTVDHGCGTEHSIWRPAGQDSPFPGIHNVQRLAYVLPAKPWPAAAMETEVGS